MSSFLKKIAPAAGIAVGAGLLGSYFFPETMGAATGGIFGSSTPAVNSLSKETASIWANPTVLSSGILAGTSLLSGMFGQQEGDITEAGQAALDEQKRQFDLTMALKQADLAQALEIAKIQAGAAGAGSGAAVSAANINRDSQLRQAKASLINNAAQQKSQALQIPLAARSEQAERAQNTGTQSGAFFNNLMQGLQTPALSRAR